MVKQVSTVISISLSASGSSTVPSLVIILKFLAMYPSSISVKPAAKKIIMDIYILFWELEKNTSMKYGIKINLKIVRILAIFIIITLSQHYICLYYLLIFDKILRSRLINK